MNNVLRVIGNAVAGGIESDKASHRVRGTHDNIQHDDSPAGMVSMLVPRQTGEQIDANGAVGHSHPADLDGLADMGSLAKLFGDPDE